MSTLDAITSHNNKVLNTLFIESETSLRNQDNPSYSDEEFRLLKVHITSELTKYVNNLKVGADPIPFMYEQSQSIIGVSTFIFYIFMTPVVIDILNETFASNENAFNTLLFDKIFRNVWLYGGSTHHSLNVSRGTIRQSTAEFTPEIFTTNPALKEYVESMFDKLEIPEHLNKSDYPNPEKAIIDFESVLYKKINSSKDIIASMAQVLGDDWNKFITYARNNFTTNMASIQKFLRTPGAILSKDKILSVMELMRTIFTFYFKGGNSIRELSQRINTLTSDIYKVTNLDETIPYGSDFDTNFLINPFLPKVAISKIKLVIELFVPQISQFIKLHPSMRNPLHNLNSKLFTGNASTISEVRKLNEQQLQMRIITDSYKDVVVNYMRPDKKRKFNSIHAPDFSSPLMKISPQRKEDGSIVRSQITVCSDPTTIDTCSNSTKVVYSQYFPPPMDVSNMIPTDKDYCFGCLQYSVNKTIPKFDLHRYFLKFEFNEVFRKANSKHRLISVMNGAFNCELLDISIVNPVYVMDSEGNLTCELIELWNNSNDIFKIEVFDKYNLAETLTSFNVFADRMFTADSPNLFQTFPVFVNGLEMQIDDLSLAVKDSILENKVEKVPKRIQRLRLLNYIKLISGIYPVDALTDISINNRLIEFGIPLYNSDPTFVRKFSNACNSFGITQKDIGDNLSYISAVYEFISAHEYSNMFKGLNTVSIESISHDGSIQKIEFIGFLYTAAAIILKQALISPTKPDIYTFVRFLESNMVDLFSNFIYFTFTPSGSFDVHFDEVRVYNIKLVELDIQIKTSRIMIQYNNFNDLLARIIKNVHVEKELKIHDFKVPSLFLHLLTSNNHSVADTTTFLSHLTDDTHRIINSIWGQSFGTPAGKIDVETPDMLNVGGQVVTTGQVKVPYTAHDIEVHSVKNAIHVYLHKICADLSQKFNIITTLPKEMIEYFLRSFSSLYPPRFLLNNEHVYDLINIYNYGMRVNVASSLNKYDMSYIKLIAEQFTQEQNVSKPVDPSAFLQASVGIPGLRIEIYLEIPFYTNTVSSGNIIVLMHTLYYNHYLSGISSFSNAVFTTSERYYTDDIACIIFPDMKFKLVYHFREHDTELAKRIRLGGTCTMKLISPTFTKDYTLDLTLEESGPEVTKYLVPFSSFLTSTLGGRLEEKIPSLSTFGYPAFATLGLVGGKRKRASRKVVKRKFKKQTIKKQRRSRK